MMSLFSDKLDRLPATAKLALETDIRALARRLKEGRALPSVAVGSGGSAVAAEYLRLCRTTVGVGSTSVETPLEFALGFTPLSKSDVWLFSAGGDNPDILAALEAARQRCARSITILTSSEDAELLGAAAGLSDVVTLVTPRAEPKDGFLATHSLAGVLVALARASATVAGRVAPAVVNDDLHSVFQKRLSPNARAEWGRKLAPASEARTLLLLADPRLRAAATLIETSLWEAAVMAVQITDFRNFAHGRHVWLQQRADAALLAMTCAETRATWTQIEGVLPSGIVRLSRHYRRCSRMDALRAILDGFAVVEALSAARGIDAGRPGIGNFARTIYEAETLPQLINGLVPSVRQKRFIRALDDEPGTDDGDLVAAHAAIQERLAGASFGAIVLDYDGTIVATEDRFEPPSAAVIAELQRLLGAGLELGIATGRGKSAGEELRKLLPEEHHARILMGYYNGALVRPLSHDLRLNPPEMRSEIRTALDWLADRPDLVRGDIEERPLQVTIDRTTIEDEDAFVAAFDAKGFAVRGELKLVQSRHSFDICLMDACKTNVVAVLDERVGADRDVLCIGDRGDADGNDHVMLGLPFGISVDHVCSREHVGWSLFGSAFTGPDALIRILAGLAPESDGFRLDLASLAGDRSDEYKRRTSDSGATR